MPKTPEAETISAVSLVSFSAPQRGGSAKLDDHRREGVCILH